MIGATSPIGLDLAGPYIKAVQCRRRSGGSRIIAAAGARRPNDNASMAEEAAFIAGLLDRAGFAGRRVVLCLPRSMVIVASLELPPRSSGAPLEQIARNELARTHRCEPGAIQSAMWDLPAPSRAGGVTHVIAAGVLVERADPLLDALENEGLEVVAIEPRSLALARAAAPLCDPAVLTCLVDANWDGLTVALVHRGIVIFERFVESVGASRIVTVLQERIGIGRDAFEAAVRRPDDPGSRAVLAGARPTVTEFLDALGPEVARSLAYVAHRYPETPVKGVIITGDATGIGGLAERITAVAGVPARAFVPHDAADAASRPGPIDTGFATAIGLSLYGSRAAVKEAA